MMEFTRALAPVSMVRYLANRIAGRATSQALTLRSGVRFLLRSKSSENTDYGVAYEVFVNQDYRPPRAIDPAGVKLVVDIGGNVGFSALYWLNAFPNCRVEVFEPHPQHLVQLRRNLAHAGQSGRVVVHGQAAGAASRPVRLSRHGTSSSTLVEADDAFPTEMVDVIGLLEGRAIDVFKLDAEGGEYEILADDRFGNLDIRHLVMEWHPRQDRQDGGAWCEQRLAAMGYAVQPPADRPTGQMLWASRNPVGGKASRPA